MHIATFKAKCASCGGEFSKPSLGDFAYGEFVFTGTRGTIYCYFSSFDHPVWDLVDRLLTPEVNAKGCGAASTFSRILSLSREEQVAEVLR